MPRELIDYWQRLKAVLAKGQAIVSVSRQATPVAKVAPTFAKIMENCFVHRATEKKKVVPPFSNTFVPREIGRRRRRRQFLEAQLYLKMVGRLIFSLWLDAQSNFPQFWQTLERLPQLGVVLTCLLYTSPSPRDS